MRNVIEVSKEAFNRIRFTSEMRYKQVNHGLFSRRLGLYNKDIFYHLNTLRKVNIRTSSAQYQVIMLVSIFFQVQIIVYHDGTHTKMQEVRMH